jgi:hypothetical protein
MECWRASWSPEKAEICISRRIELMWVLLRPENSTGFVFVPQWIFKYVIVLGAPWMNIGDLQWQYSNISHPRDARSAIFGLSNLGLLHGKKLRSFPVCFADVHMTNVFCWEASHWKKLLLSTNEDQGNKTESIRTKTYLILIELCIFSRK